MAGKSKSQDGGRKDPPINGNAGPAIPQGYDGPEPNELGRVAITFLFNVGQYNIGECAGFIPAQSKDMVDKEWAVYGDARHDFVNGKYSPAHTREASTAALSVIGRGAEGGPTGPLHENGNNAGQTRALTPADNTTNAVVLEGDWRNTMGPADKRKIAAQISRQTAGRATEGTVKSYQELSAEQAEAILDEYYSMSAQFDPVSAETARDDRGSAVIGTRGTL